MEGTPLTLLTPTDEAIREALPWWTARVMLEARGLGVQHRALKALREVWRLQDVVPWTHPLLDTPAVSDQDGGSPADWLDGPEPGADALEPVRSWASSVIRSHSVFYSWCDLSDLESIDKAPEVELTPPPWASVIKARRW